jgi:hypothetical protein
MELQEREEYLKEIADPKTEADNRYLAGLLDASGSLYVIRPRWPGGFWSVVLSISVDGKKRWFTGRSLYYLIKRVLPYIRKRKELFLTAWEFLNMTPDWYNVECWDKLIKIAKQNEKKGADGTKLLEDLMKLREEAIEYRESRAAKRLGVRSRLPRGLRTFLGRIPSSDKDLEEEVLASIRRREPLL